MFKHAEDASASRHLVRYASAESAMTSTPRLCQAVIAKGTSSSAGSSQPTASMGVMESSGRSRRSLTAHASFPSTRIALTGRSTTVSFGKMPVTLLLPLIAAMASHPRCRWPEAQVPVRAYAAAVMVSSAAGSPCSSRSSPRRSSRRRNARGSSSSRASRGSDGRARRRRWRHSYAHRAAGRSGLPPKS